MTALTGRLVNVTVLAVLLGAMAVSAPAQDGIRNFLRVNADFCTAGQPDLAQLSGLREQGIRAVLNLRPADEFDDSEEEARVRELGMKYFNIPVSTGSPIPASQFDEFLRLSDDETNRPMFIHCASANRVGAFWLVRRVLRDGWEISRAEEEAMRVGLRAASLRESALDYIARHR